VNICDYLGSPHLIGATLERAGIVPDPSMAQIRQLITGYAALPLGSQVVHEKLDPHIKAILLYGHHNTGKKLLVNALAHCTGALINVLFDQCWRSVNNGSHILLVQELAHYALIFCTQSCSLLCAYSRRAKYCSAQARKPVARLQ
jgi:hypothetical protein